MLLRGWFVLCIIKQFDISFWKHFFLYFLDSGSSLNHFLTHWLVLLIYFFKKTFNLCAYACFVSICPWRQEEGI